MTVNCNDTTITYNIPYLIAEIYATAHTTNDVAVAMVLVIFNTNF